MTVWQVVNELFMREYSWFDIDWEQVQLLDVIQHLNGGELPDEYLDNLDG